MALVSAIFVGVIPCAYVAYLLRGQDRWGLTCPCAEAHCVYLVGPRNILGLLALMLLSAPRR